MVRGLSNKEVAAELDCAENTVEFHVTQLLEKACAQVRMQLIATFWARASGAQHSCRRLSGLRVGVESN